VFETMVWAIDGSEAADRARPYVKALASRFGSAVVAVDSVEFLLGPRVVGQPVHVDEDQVQAKVKGQVGELRDAGLDATFKRVGGPTLQGPAHVIADGEGEAGADAIIVGTRGHTALAGLLVGGVIQRVLHIARCPVIAVPAAKRRFEGQAATEHPAATSSANWPTRPT
jgi:nucleotide-binding universal stress UspA family protein